MLVNVNIGIGVDVYMDGAVVQNLIDLNFDVY